MVEVYFIYLPGEFQEAKKSLPRLAKADNEQYRFLVRFWVLLVLSDCIKTHTHANVKKQHILN